MRGRYMSLECLCLQDVRRMQVLDVFFLFFFQAEDGIRDLVRSRGLGDVYKRQGVHCAKPSHN